MMVEDECGCWVRHVWHDDYEIIYCTMHTAAPVLLKEVLPEIETTIDGWEASGQEAAEHLYDLRNRIRATLDLSEENA